MKWIAAMLCIVPYGIVEGSDVQGYELTAAIWALLITCILSAMTILYFEYKRS